jgi:pSer/pThr/pTyr-binding forkhead associated (FHA) protein
VDKEVFKALSGGLGLASKLMGKGVDEVSRVLTKPEQDHNEPVSTGLYFVRSPWAEVGAPHLSYMESQTPSRLSLSMLRNLTMSAGEKEFVHGLNAFFHGDLQSSEEHFRDATRRPESKIQITDSFFVLGAILLQMGQPAEAGKHFKTALLAQQGLGRQIRKWAPSLHLSIPLTPSSSFCFGPDLIGLTTLLAYCQASGQIEEAVDTMEQLLQLVENDPVALFFLSLFRMQLGDHRGLFQSLQKLLPDSNVNVAGMVFLGKACHRLGDPSTARDIFKKALQYENMDFALKLDLRMALSQTLAAEGSALEAQRERDQVAKEDPAYRSWEERLYQKGHVEKTAPPAPVAPEPKIQTAALNVESAPQPSGPISLIDSTGKIQSLICAARNLVVPLNKKPLVIGREEGDVVLAGDSASSRQHARVTFDEGEYWVEDLMSTNGTLVNRYKIKGKVELHRGDVLQIGESIFVVS